MHTSSPDYRHLLKRYAGYAPVYDRRFARYSAATLEHALQALPAEREAHLLDVACGTGLLIHMLHQQRPHWHMTGVDISPDMLARARQRMAHAPQIQWKQGHAEQLPVESAQ